MEHINRMGEYRSGVDHSRVQAARIRMISLDLGSGRMVLRFYHDAFPTMILRSPRMPAPNDWLVRSRDGSTAFKSDLEFGSEYRLIT